MKKIENLILENFKFFNGEQILNFDCKNILIYGENGSGKSSIYWALYTFLQSSLKEDTSIQKYFDLQHSERLVNRFINPSDKSSLKLMIKDNQNISTTYEISLDSINTNKSDTEIKKANLASDFINYRLLSRLYHFKNSEDIELFSMFEDEILSYITIENNNLDDLWKTLKVGLTPRPKMSSPIYKEFQEKIALFNTKFETFLQNITRKANDILKDNFKEQIKIFIDYKNATYDDFEVGSTTKRNHITIPPKINLHIEFSIDNHKIDKPHTFLNEARLTAIALSLRFAILKQRLSIDSLLKILVLDDLLISLDMTHRVEVINFILNDEDLKDYQLIIMTHDRAFFELVKHKTTFISEDNWKYLEMYSQDKEGIPFPFFIKSLSYLEKAEKYYYENEYEIAGNFLRKEAENFCKKFLPKKYHYNDNCTLKDLNGLILECKNFADNAGFESELFRELDSYRKFVLNSTSHDSYDVPKFKNDIKKCLDNLKELNNIKNQPFLNRGKELVFECKCMQGDLYKIEIILEDDFRMLKKDNNDTVISKGLINYRILKNGTYTSSELQHENCTLNSFYTKFYNKSDKTNNSNFLEEISILDTNDKIIDYCI